MQKELVPYVDENDVVIQPVEREKAYLEGLLHRGVHAVVRNERGEYLVPQRSTHKSTWPGRFDLGLAETVQSGESYLEALKRGLNEELSLKHLSCAQVGERFRANYNWGQYKIFVMVCLYVIDVSAEPTYADGEVQGSSWMTKEELTELVNQRAEDCTPWLVQDWNYYLGTTE